MSFPETALETGTATPSADASAKALPGPRRPRAESAIERARIVPEAPPAPAPGGTPRGRNPLLALLHDGRDRAITDAIATGVGDALKGGTLALVLQPLPDDDAAEHLRDFLRRFRPAGVVLGPSLSGRADLGLVCAAAQVSCVPLGPAGGRSGLSCDERGAAAHLVTWLVGQGHARIGLVAGPDHAPSARLRELGYLDAMADHGLDRGPALIVPGDDTFLSGIEAGRLLLEISPRPTAIVASNDEMAVGVLHAAAQMGVMVPAQLSVAGFDDMPLAARALPPLTSVHLPWQRMGHEAARRIATGEATAPATFSAELVVRASVQPPPS